MLKITESRLRRIILEEIAAMEMPEEGQEGARAEDADVEALELSSTISKKVAALVKAIKSFKSDCPEACMHHVGGELKKLEKTLINMGKNPGDYITSKVASLPGDESSELFAPEEEEADDEEEEESELSAADQEDDDEDEEDGNW